VKTEPNAYYKITALIVEILSSTEVGHKGIIFPPMPLTLIPTGMAIYGSRHFKALFLKKPSSMKNLKKIANPGELFLVCF
jgi:hypothetical protein